MKKWIKKYFFFTIAIVLLVSIFNFVMDPFQQYRKVSLYPVTYAKERFMNPGLAKNYDYDSVVIGSSMTENFILTNVSNILQIEKPIKFSLYGGTGFEYFLTLDTAFRHKKIANVFFGLDAFTYPGEVKRFTFGEKAFPFHLYTEKVSDDYKYLVSLDTLKETLSMLLKAVRYEKNQPPLSFDSMYEWQYLHHQKFGHVNWSEVWNNRVKDFNKDFNPSDYQLERFITSFEYNFLPFIEQHPETKFTIFYPPYSILAYKDIESKEWLTEYLAFKSYIASLTDKYSNLRVYDFQIAKEITHQLDNYKDLTHYHQKINKWMLLQIRDDYFRVTTSNSTRINNQFKYQIESYSVEVLESKISK